MTERLTAAAVQSRAGLQDWRVLAGRLHATFRTGDLARGIELVRRIGEIADELDHHPDLDVRYFRVHVRSVTHDAGGLTERDVRLAGRVSAVAAELGVAAEPARPQQLEIGIDALEIPAVRPFWRAVLGYKDPQFPGDDPATADLVDPAGRGPSVRFQRMDVSRPQPGTVHLDIHVPHDAVRARVQAALDAGGRLVTDADAPPRWVLADAEGNQARLCTWEAPEG
ncbi:4a-hydroxytetrahydrobiopterin dehydratase [Georgenia yuyongxinii]|uniref:Putative pterin-4-alpha-carbinolamine dehydratase n=1 Tax=Georgenia yuyongxinii TaxID=2589797 RepID=A0A552WQ54_9MICO|nr:4a-hydroxytetrahydrobiopterin dehydratase [Georgenia yuyongxinii]TRW44633.1 4a-hydroxytetrahydrobiopterin dehydratase [Georgenia yuyongxinii]